jgi:hypothetical protein
MDPNSRNQVWSRWTFNVTPATARPRPLANVRENCARFARKAFGSATEMRVSGEGGRWCVDVRTEGHPVHDPAYVAWMRAQWERFFVSGFGVGTSVEINARLEAGDRQDGRPATQLIILPTIQISQDKGSHV